MPTERALPTQTPDLTEDFSQEEIGKKAIELLELAKKKISGLSGFAEKFPGFFTDPLEQKTEERLESQKREAVLVVNGSTFRVEYYKGEVSDLLLLDQLYSTRNHIDILIETDSLDKRKGTFALRTIRWPGNTDELATKATSSKRLQAGLIEGYLMTLGKDSKPGANGKTPHL